MDEENSIEVPAPLGISDMKPLKDRAFEGRVNPKGIPCLYLATTKRAAVSEVRPWIGALVSVAQLKTERNLTIVDCSKLHKTRPIFLEEPPQQKIDDAVWASIDRAFSEPITPTEDSADYAPTQTLAELFCSKGYDGLAYKSAFGEDGYNIALFDLESATVINCALVKVTELDVKFVDEGNSYFVRPKSKEPS